MGIKIKETVKTDETESTSSDSTAEHFLVVYNDDYHTFEYVTESLISICGHEPEQALQCTFIIHYNGKCDVKKGSFNYLRPMKRALTARDLKVTIN